MVGCFIGIVMIAGVGINPCNVTSMHDYTYKGDAYCKILFNSGNAWSGQDSANVKTTCEEAYRIIEEERKKGGE